LGNHWKKTQRNRKNILAFHKHIKFTGLSLTDTLTLLLGAFIGIISGIATYSVNHFLNVREKKLLRDFEVREKGRDFFHQIYGTVTTLSDMVVPFKDEQITKEAVILAEEGYIALPKEQIIVRYQIAYSKYAKLWYESREKGLEIFLMKDFVEIISKFWAYAGYFNQDMKNWANREAISNFEKIRQTYCDRMDRLMGIAEPHHIIPKWLNPNTWSRQLRGENIESI
jgi:hypothetical protein